MTGEQRLAALKSMIDTPEQDDVLLTYLRIAEGAVLRRRYPFDDTVTAVPERYEDNVLKIAQYLLNKRGAEGQISHSENGVSRSYESGDIPESMLSDIVPFVGVI